MRRLRAPLRNCNCTNRRYGVSASDPLTIAGAVFALGLATMAASYLPARRAMRLDAARTLAGQ